MAQKINITQVLRLTLIIGLIAWCFLIVKPFIIVIIWAIILAVALYPIYNSWLNKFSDQRKKIGAILFTVVIATIVFVPTYFLTTELFHSTKTIVEQVKTNSVVIQKPTADVKSWPLIGERVYKEWSLFSKNAKSYMLIHEDFLIEKGSSLLTNVTGIFGTLIAFMLSFLISVVFMHKADLGYKTGHLLFQKIFGPDAEEIMLMCRDTIRSVVKGILLVALIQTIFALIGFKAIGLPASGFFAFLVLLAAIMQIPAILVMLPAILIAFSIAEPTVAIIFTIYSIAVALSDNFLKPIFLGKGLQTPMIVILIGTIGGMLLHGIIGLFIGAVVLSVAHKLYMYWVNTKEIESANNS